MTPTAQQMIGMVATLADEQAVDNVVAHIQTFPDTAVSSTIEGDVGRGQKHYNICAYCHGADGMGIRGNECAARGRHVRLVSRKTVA